MKRLLKRGAFLLAMAAVAIAPLTAPAAAATNLLEVRNQTTYWLHFVCTPQGGVPMEMALEPGKSWYISKPGTYWFTGSLKEGTKTVVTLQQHGILLKEGQRLMVLFAVFDNVGTNSYRWYTFIPY